VYDSKNSLAIKKSTNTNYKFILSKQTQNAVYLVDVTIALWIALAKDRNLSLYR